MPKCKDCFHFKVCEFNLEYYQGIDLTSIILAAGDENSAKECPYFKDDALIAELPCKIGDTLYVLIEESKRFGGSYIKEETVTSISTDGAIWTVDCYYDRNNIEKIIFFTYEEAEKALKRLKIKSI